MFKNSMWALSIDIGSVFTTTTWFHDVLLIGFKLFCIYYGFPGSSVSRDSACIAGDLGLIPESGRSPGEGNGKSLQYPCLENPMDRGPWWAAVHGITKSWAQLSK